MNKKKVLIVFSNLHLPYSPSTLNLFYALKRKKFDGLLLAPEPKQYFFSSKVSDEGVKYINVDRKGKTYWTEFTGKSYKSYYFERSIQQENDDVRDGSRFIKEIEKSNADIIIAVDFFSLWCVQQAGKSAHLLSLEILGR